MLQAARDLSHLPKSLTSRSYCAHCYWEGPLSLYCKGCAIKTGSHLTITTRYCSASCRELDRQRHQQRCELRRRFARATHMMKSLHILLEQTNTTLSIYNTFETGGMLFLTEKYQKLQMTEPNTRYIQKLNSKVQAKCNCIYQKLAIANPLKHKLYSMRCSRCR